MQIIIDWCHNNKITKIVMVLILVTWICHGQLIGSNEYQGKNTPSSISYVVLPHQEKLEAHYHD